jgi:hypothetical protein
MIQNELKILEWLLVMVEVVVSEEDEAAETGGMTVESSSGLEVGSTVP